MSDDTDLPLSPPEDLPADLTAALAAHADDPHLLRETIIYAQELLNHLHEPSSEIEPLDGEEILHIAEHTGYTEVVKRTQGDHDAYVYHVVPEHHIGGETHLHWTLLGRRKPDE
jgi:hypothetical protein